VLRVLTRQPIVRGMTIRGPGVAVGTVIVGELSTPRMFGVLGKSTPNGGLGRYVVSKPQNVGTGPAPIAMTATLVSGPRPDPPGPGQRLPPLPSNHPLYPLTRTNPPGISVEVLAKAGFSWPMINTAPPITPPPITPPPNTPGSGQPLRLLPTSHPLYPMTQTNPPGITPANLAQLGYAWPTGPPPPPITPGSGRQPPPPPITPGSVTPEHKQILDTLQNENNTARSDMARLRDDLLKSEKIHSNGGVTIRQVNTYISNMTLYRDDITQDLDKKVRPNLNAYAGIIKENEGKLVKLRSLMEATRKRMTVFERLEQQIQNGSGITVAELKREIDSINREFEIASSAYNSTGSVDVPPIGPNVFTVTIQRPLPLLQLPSVEAPGSSTAPSWGIPLTRARNPQLYDMIAANPNPAMWAPLLKSYNPPFLYPTDLSGNASTIRATSVTSIAGFSDYKGAIASWTESFAPFEN
jgi:hypothetical protein